MDCILTEMEWQEELPPFIIKRLPIRFTYDNNYFNDMYQGIPIGGYTKIIEKMLEGIEVRLNTDFLANREEFGARMSIALHETIYKTGRVFSFYAV